jgi:hypothetical protein
MLKDKCLKCGTKIPEFSVDNHAINVALCKNCHNLWHKFHNEYVTEIEKKYSHGKNNHHASWSVFIGELPNLWGNKDKEKVQFT